MDTAKHTTSQSVLAHRLIRRHVRRKQGQNPLSICPCAQIDSDFALPGYSAIKLSICPCAQIDSSILCEIFYSILCAKYRLAECITSQWTPLSRLLGVRPPDATAIKSAAYLHGANLAAFSCALDVRTARI